MPASYPDLSANTTARDALELLGDSWQASGASGVGVYRNGVPFWSRGLSSRVDAFSAEAIDRDGNEFSLWITGLAASEANKLRLRNDVLLLASVVQLESEVGKLTDRLIEQQDQLVAVSELASAVRDRRKTQEVLETLVELASTLTGAEYAAAVVVTADEQFNVEFPSSEFTNIDLRGVFLFASEINRAILLTDTNPETWPPSFAVDSSFRRLVIAPIRLSGRVAGAIVVLDRQSELLTIASRHLLETVAAQAEAIIELILSSEQLRKRDLLERDAELARAVQRNLIPAAAPDIASLDVALRYRPASELGGDLFDCVRRADGRLVIGVADVSGKGTAAALVMAAARMSVRGAAFRGSASDAASMMRRITEDLYDDLGNMSRFMTIFLGVIDPDLGQIVAANAGHSPVILAPANEPARLLEAEEPPIGVLPEYAKGNQIIPFALGDVIVVATDGFPEAACPEGELFGYERMLALVDRMKRSDAEQIAEALVAAIDQFSDGTEQSDDQALVIVKRRAA